MGTKGGRPRKYTTDAERARAYRQRKRQSRVAQAISVHFKHETTLWSTPQVLFDALDAEFHFTTDVCADASNAKCAHYFSPAQDGLRQRWEGVCWMNPPYGAEIRYLPGRQRFGESGNSAPFPSAVVIFRPTPGARGE